jgi:hypothetical protein
MKKTFAKLFGKRGKVMLNDKFELMHNVSAAAHNTNVYLYMRQHQ